MRPADDAVWRVYLGAAALVGIGWGIVEKVFGA